MGEESRATNWGQFRLVIGLSFLQSMIWGLVIAMFPLFARELGADELAIGSLAAVHPLLSVLGAVPMGLLANRLGRRGMFYLAYALSLGAALAYMVTRSPGGLVVPQLLFGLSAVAYWPTQHSHISDNVDPVQLARLFGLSMGLTGLGGIIGPVMAGRIADTFGFQAMYGFCAAISVAGMALCIKVQAPVQDDPAHRGPPLNLRSIRTMLARPTLQFVYLSAIAMFVQWGLRDTFLPLYAADLNLSMTAIGALATFQTTSKERDEAAAGCARAEGSGGARDSDFRVLKRLGHAGGAGAVVVPRPGGRGLRGRNRVGRRRALDADQHRQCHDPAGAAHGDVARVSVHSDGAAVQFGHLRLARGNHRHSDGFLDRQRPGPCGRAGFDANACAGARACWVRCGAGGIRSRWRRPALGVACRRGGAEVPGAPKCRGSGAPGFRGAGVSGCRGAGAPGRRGAGVPVASGCGRSEYRFRGNLCSE